MDYFTCSRGFCSSSLTADEVYQGCIAAAQSLALIDAGRGLATGLPPLLKIHEMHQLVKQEGVPLQLSSTVFFHHCIIKFVICDFIDKFLCVFYLICQLLKL